MVFKFKVDEIKSAPRSLLLNHTKKIVSSDDRIYQELLKQYQDLGVKPSPYLKAACTITNAILTHERMYFALTRTAMQTLMKNDMNIPEKYRNGFNTNYWARILATLYNDFGVIKLVHKGSKRNASAFEVIHPALLKHLEPKVDREKQLAETLAFCQKKT